MAFPWTVLILRIVDQVADAHCPGNIVEDSDSYELTYYSRPTVQLPAETVRHKKSQHYERPAICAGVEDHMTVALQGRR